MMKSNSFLLLLVFAYILFLPVTGVSQCNVQASICEPGVAGPFNFVSTGGPYAGGSFANAGCSTGAGGQHYYGFITLYITEDGFLNILINGNSSSGFIDVAIFNVPDGVAPCTAIQSSSNAIGCNFASTAGGCVQFGNTFPCSSSVPAPYVYAGDEIVIVAQSYTPGTSTNFTLELGTTTGSAETGPPDATILPSGPFCTTDGLTQLIAENMGGTWSGPGVSSTGMFNPAAAGVGTHTINYSIGVPPCNESSSTQITVGSIAISNLDVGACQAGGVYGLSGTIQVSNPPPSGQLIVENCEGEQAVVATAPFIGSYPFNLSGLNANGAPCDIHAYFTDSDCSHILNYNAPVCDGCTIFDLGADVQNCDPGGTYSIGGNIVFSEPPTTGTLVVTTTCGGSQTFNPPFVSPVSYSIGGLPADGSSCTVRAYFSVDEDCQLTEQFTAPGLTTPVFDPISACLGDTPPPLPAVSLNGVPGTWSPGVISTSAVGTTNYTFTPNSGECAVTAVFPVTVNELPDVQIPAAGVLYECLVSPTVQLNGSSSTPGVNYLWTGNGIVSGQTTQTVTVNATGTYILTVTDPATGCSNSDNVTVVGDGNEPDVSIAPPAVITCDNPAVTLSADSPTPGSTFVWTSNPGIVSGENTLTPTVDQAGTYQITVTAPNGCTNAASAVVTGGIYLPDVNTSPSDFVISCTTPVVTINGSSTVQGVTYSWSGPGIVSGQNTGVIGADQAGTYVVTVTNPANNCVNTASFNVTGNTNQPDVTIGNAPQIDCNNLNVQLPGASSTPGAVASWSGPGIVSGGSTFVPTVNAAGTYVLTVTDPVNNCTNTASVTVTQIVPVVASSFPDTVICGYTFNVPLQDITANGNVTWVEQNGNGSFSNPNILNPVFTGVNGTADYMLIFTDECGYTSFSRITMESQPQVTAPSVSCDLAEFNIVTQSYNGGVWTVIENPNTPYIEDTTLTFVYGDTLSGGIASTAVNVSHYGTYTLHFNSDDVCPNPSITLNFPPYLWTEINDTTLCTGVQYQLFAWETPYEVDYLWNTGANGTSITVTQPGEYIVTVSNECHSYSDTAFVHYEICDIDAPNIISLSSQSGNNIWYVSSLGVAEFNCIIVNRWGNVIYEYNDVNGHWDGRDMSGNTVTEGVYFYTIEATYEGGEQVKKHGFVHVVW